MKKTGLFSIFTSLLLTLALVFGCLLCGCGTEEILSVLDDAASAIESTSEDMSYDDSSYDSDSIDEAEKSVEPSEAEASQDDIPAEDEWLYSKDDVALYLEVYGKLPENFITKSQARDLGWVSEEGNLWEVADGMCIGGDVFGNREGILPEKSGRVYYECDVDYDGGYRSSRRIVFSNDGLIYYTQDHYETFTLLWEP